MKVDFFSFSYIPLEVRQAWRRELDRTISSGVFIGGVEVSTFEDAWAKFTGSKFALGVGNGFDGLVLALKTLNIGSGDFVAVPAHTFIATWNAIITTGAIPIGIDVDDDGLMDLDAFARVASRVRAVIPVHMHGAVVNMKELSGICRNNNLKEKIRIVEDASQAHGAISPDGSSLGTYSEAVVYSMYPTKNLGALGDAGIITTNIVEVYERVKSLGSYGSSREDKYTHLELGYNSRLDSIQASILKENLNRLPNWNSIRKALSKQYIERLDGCVSILQENRQDSVRHHFCILTPNRDELRTYLLTKGVSTEIHYPRVAGVEALSFINKKMNFPKAESLAKRILSLPLSQWHNEEQIDYVSFHIKAWMQS